MKKEKASATRNGVSLQSQRKVTTAARVSPAICATSKSVPDRPGQISPVCNLVSHFPLRNQRFRPLRLLIGQIGSE